MKKTKGGASRIISFLLALIFVLASSSHFAYAAPEENAGYTVLQPDNIKGRIQFVDESAPRLRAAVDSDIHTFHIRIALDRDINLADHIEGGRIVYSTRLGSQDVMGPDVLPVQHVLNNGGTDFSFLMTEGKTELESLGYTIEGEYPEGSHFADYVGQTLGITVKGQANKPAIVDFTATVAYAQGGHMILPMQVKILPKFFLTKNLKTVGGANHPAMNFEFEFQAENGAPALGLDPVTLSYTADEKGIKTSEDIISLIEQKQPFPNSGVYTYTLTETSTTYTQHDGDDYIDNLVTSKAKYQVTFTVESNPKGAGYRVLSVAVKKLNNDDGTDANGAKQDNYYKEGEENDIRFENEYSKEVKENKGKDPLTGHGLFVKKTVTGALGDKNAYFPFTVTLTAPADLTVGKDNQGAPVAPKTRARIFNSRTLKFENDVTANGITTADANGYFDVLYGTALNVNLKHGQAIVFEKAYVGSTLEATETDAKSHTLTYQSVSGGQTATDANTITVSDKGINKIEALNDKDQTTVPTGLYTNQSSSMAMMLIAGAGLAVVLFFVVKNKKKAEMQ